MPRILLLAALALAVLPASVGHSQVQQLIGTVGPGFTIGLTDPSGKHVDLLTEGTYQLLVHDLSDIHNFVLGKKETGERGASTEVEFVGDMTFTVNLTRGHWAYACSPHFQTMNGSFAVVPATPAPTTTTTPAKPKPLTARLGPAGVTLSAKRVARRVVRDHRRRPFNRAELPLRRPGREPQYRQDLRRHDRLACSARRGCLPLRHGSAGSRGAWSSSETTRYWLHGASPT